MGILSIKDYIFGGILVTLSIFLGYFWLSNVSLSNQVSLLETDKVRYETAISLAQKEQIEKIVYVDKEVEVVKEVTKNKIKYIKEYVYDNNKTDCANAIGILRRSGF